MLGDSSLVVVSVAGSIGIIPIIKELSDWILDIGYRIVFLLGPTSPSQLSSEHKVGWVSFTSDESGQLAILQPENLFEISLFVDEVVKETDGQQTAILGDFLDTLLTLSLPSETFFMFYSQLVAKIRRLGLKAFFIVKEDLHEPRKIEAVKRFADVIIEYRQREEGLDLVQVMRIINLRENTSSGWILRTSQNLMDTNALELNELST
jgi:hypothetical protein